MKFKDIPFRVWILAAALIIAFILISPNPWAEGIKVQQVDASSMAYELGIRSGQELISVNDVQVNSIGEYLQAVEYLEHEPINFSVGLVNASDEVLITVDGDLEWSLTSSLEVIRSAYPEVPRGSVIESVNGVPVESLEELNAEVDKVIPSERIVLVTDTTVAAYRARGVPDISVGDVEKSNINKGLDLEGGTRVLIRPVSDDPITDANVSDMVDVLQNRLDTFGLSDVTIRQAEDFEGTHFILIEVAGLSKRDVERLLESQGKFEARIGEEVVFRGGKQDIQFVCRNDGSCSGVRGCAPVAGGDVQCTFDFQIRLSPDAAQRHADITRDIPLVTSAGGSQVLEKKVDFYLDEVLVSSLDIGASLKGSAVQDIVISGPGVGASQSAALENAEQEMNFLQSVLITGSLPYEIEIVKIDTVSPSLGEEFLQNAILVGIIAMIGVLVVVYIRYRSFAIVIPMMITMLSEVIITLAFAPLLKWNLDLVAIAGIVAAVGTGVDDQIVIADEVVRGREASLGWKARVKNAFFIIMVAYVTTLAAMLPLFRVGAGLVRGFAITTIIGVTVGILVTRPAYAAFVEKFWKE